ncbi:hypothetical protein GNI_041380 [Gregarina niphandrodes]|uniref:Uncharacterized protein n=1 Tax=Gregarina niphandrodes TaxID=110365 RepID=A0A023BA79_GRENI|nr:hypothetical protein GNI_041380 [Gregarina niphandrodes]EZG77885.1 hypothetical protein GNI_041380 [Gregarina niphandrodes]|eukprot:XP_011129477.1 hypothetical protein GNI_041380 [Gregarina niphandrodes]
MSLPSLPTNKHASHPPSTLNHTPSTHPPSTPHPQRWRTCPLAGGLVRWLEDLSAGWRTCPVAGPTSQPLQNVEVELQVDAPSAGLLDKDLGTQHVSLGT